MSNSFPERNKTTVLEAFQTVFNKRDYSGDTDLFTEPHSAEHRYPRGSTRADRDPASDAQVRAGDHPSRKGLGDRAGSLLGYPERLSGLPSRAQSAWVWVNGGRPMNSPVVRSKNALKRNSMRFGVALLLALAIFIAVPNAAQAAAAQRHDQVPGFYRLKVGDLEVTALFDGPGVFDSTWLNGTKATMNGVAQALHEDPHLLEVSDVGFLVNTGKQLILVDAGSGTWWGGGAMGRLAGSLRSAGYTPEQVDIVLVTHLHSDHVGGLTTQDGKRVFPNAEVYVAKAESDFWLSPELAAKAPKDAQLFFQSAQAIAAPYIKADKWHTFSGSETIVDGMQLVPLPGHTPGHTGYEFSSKGQQILFWGDTIHAQRVQLQHPEVTVVFDIDPTAAAVTRNQLLPELAREEVVIAGPHMVFPGLGRLHKEGSGYSWTPVAFTDQWAERGPSPQK
jgi:glyoxylase-like metal-dependent hydrolase (beta-lactamase superfamily II)